MLFNYFDYYVLILILIFNFGVWKFRILKKNNFGGIAFYFLIFFILIPYLNWDVEIQVEKSKFEMLDGGNLLYTYLRFPTWWFIGIMEFFLIRYLIKNPSKI